MIIAMITVRMVQPAVYEVIDMITMRHLYMSAAWAVRVRAVDLRGAVHGICGIDRDDMFVHVILVHMVKMTIVKIVHMAVMANRGVSAIGAMAMRMALMVFFGTSGHRQTPYAWGPRSLKILRKATPPRCAKSTRAQRTNARTAKD